MLLIVTCLLITATLWVVHGQHTDGLIINLSGRQRMLAEKFTKEILYEHIGRDCRHDGSQGNHCVRPHCDIIQPDPKGLTGRGRDLSRPSHDSQRDHPHNHIRRHPTPT